jgi:hypothetical protein
VAEDRGCGADEERVQRRGVVGRQLGGELTGRYDRLGGVSMSSVPV